MPRRAGLLPAQGSPGGFPEDNGVMQTGREQLMDVGVGATSVKAEEGNLHRFLERHRLGEGLE